MVWRLRKSQTGNKVAHVAWSEDMSDGSSSRTDVLRASPPMFDSRLLDVLSRVHPAGPVLIFSPAGLILQLVGVGSGGARKRGRRGHRGADARRLRPVDAVRVLAGPGRLSLRAAGRPRRTAALDHPRRPPQIGRALW